MENKVTGLTPKTNKIIDSISKLECIKPFTLVGGTALSIQLGTRESEDLDFMSWRNSKNEKREIDWPKIQKELGTIGNILDQDIYDLDHIEFNLEGVKLSFYANPNYTPVTKPVPFLNNIILADIKSIGAMKMEVMMRRSNFRDYYDLFSILKSGYDINEIIEIATKYSGRRLKTKNLLSMITDSSRFEEDDKFKTLNPKYDISAKDIELFIKSLLKP